MSRDTKKPEPPKPRVLVMQDNSKRVRELIQRKLDLVNGMVEDFEGKRVTVSDEAYEELGKVTGGNPAHTFYIFEQIAEGLGREGTKLPYEVTANDVREKAVGKREFEKIRRSGMRNVSSIEKRPWWER